MRGMDRKTNRQGIVFVLALALAGCNVVIDGGSDAGSEGEASDGGSDGPGGSGMIAGSSSSSSSEGSTSEGTTGSSSEDTTGEPPDTSDDTTGSEGSSSEGTTGLECGTVEIVAGVCVCDGEPVSKSVPGPCGPCAFDVAGQCVCPPGLGPQHWC